MFLLAKWCHRINVFVCQDSGAGSFANRNRVIVFLLAQFWAAARSIVNECQEVNGWENRKPPHFIVPGPRIFEDPFPTLLLVSAVKKYSLGSQN